MQTDKLFLLVSSASIVADSGLISNVCKIYLLSGDKSPHRFLFQLVSLEGDGINSITVIFIKNQ